jgi:hypothetical protein
MSLLYRAAITVTRKQPYVDWANSFDDDGPLLTPELAGDRRSIYLVPESDQEPDVEALVGEFWQHIFEEELAAWMDREEDWPTPLTREMFDAWFDVEVTDTVFDLTPDEPLTQADVEAVDLDAAVHRCAWCDIELEEGAGRFAGFKLADRGRLEHREGLTVQLALDEEHVAAGIMTRANSEAARDGEDLVFRACTGACERALRSAVPKALRKMFSRTRT